MHILPNILRNKGNQAMKFGQIIQINMINFCLEKFYAKYGEIFPDPFLKNQQSGSAV